MESVVGNMFGEALVKESFLCELNSSLGCASHILTFRFLPQRLLNNFLLRFYQQSLSLPLSVGKKSEPKRVSRPKQLERVSTKPWSACSFPRPLAASAQFLVNFSASSLLSGSHCSPSQMQSIALFIHAMCCFINKPHCCLKGMLQIHEHIVFMDQICSLHLYMCSY